MSKQFFTERDIEDLASQGVFTLTIGENVVLTELAFEKAQRLGVKLIQQHQLPPSAPIRPYLSETVAPSPSSQHHTAGLPLNKDESCESASGSPSGQNLVTRSTPPCWKRSSPGCWTTSGRINPCFGRAHGTAVCTLNIPARRD